MRVKGKAKTRTYKDHDREFRVGFRSLRPLNHEVQAILRCVRSGDRYEGGDSDEPSEDLVDDSSKGGRKIEGFADDILLRTVEAMLLQRGSVSKARCRRRERPDRGVEDPVLSVVLDRGCKSQRAERRESVGNTVKQKSALCISEQGK